MAQYTRTSGMAKKALHIGIVGAGLGELAAAIGIARAGHKISMLEQTAELREVSQYQSHSTIPSYPYSTSSTWCHIRSKDIHRAHYHRVLVAEAKQLSEDTN
ncbi:MAG: hypothetical protein Q9217_003707 [Psora testacea]